ncbi:unnamed protein product [Calypogeia fissa]
MLQKRYAGADTKYERRTANELSKVRRAFCDVAKERRGFPSTCCLTFDGIRILSTGFEGPEKTSIHQLVRSMCGAFCTKASMDVDFVIAKDVLSPKYKWAAFTLRKPILGIQWLRHCSREHRRVPYEPYRLPIFTGVIMCTSGFLLGPYTSNSLTSSVHHLHKWPSRYHDMHRFDEWLNSYHLNPFPFEFCDKLVTKKRLFRRL